MNPHVSAALDAQEVAASLRPAWRDRLQSFFASDEQAKKSDAEKYLKVKLKLSNDPNPAAEHCF